MIGLPHQHLPATPNLNGLTDSCSSGTITKDKRIPNSAIALQRPFLQYSALMSIGRKQYPFDLIEPKWQAIWDRQQTFRAWNPGEALPPQHPFALRHKLAGNKTQAS